MRRLRKKFDAPKQLWNRDRIEHDKGLLSEYGLQNMKEIWKAEARLRDLMRQAKRLVALRTAQSEKEKKLLLDKLVKVGLISPSSSVEDVLGIGLKQLLDRRLQTVVFKAGLANTAKQARQLIVHGHVAVAGSKVTVPSYLVSVSEESSVSFVPGSSFAKQHEEKKTKVVEKKEEKKSKEKPKKGEKSKKDVVKDGEKSEGPKDKGKSKKGSAAKEG